MIRIYHDLIGTQITYSRNKIKKILKSNLIQHSVVRNQVIIYCYTKGYNNLRNLMRFVQYKFSYDKKVINLSKLDPIDIKEFYVYPEPYYHINFSKPFCGFDKDFIEYLFISSNSLGNYLGFTLDFKNNSINFISLPENTRIDSNNTFCFSTENIYIIDFFHGNHVALPRIVISRIKSIRDEYEKLDKSYILRVVDYLYSFSDVFLMGVLWWNGKYDYVFDVYRISKENTKIIYSIPIRTHLKLKKISCFLTGDRLVVILEHQLDSGFFFIFSTENNTLNLLNENRLIQGTFFYSRFDDIFLIQEYQTKSGGSELHIVYDKSLFDNTILEKMKYNMPKTIW